MDDQTIIEQIRTGKTDPALDTLYRQFPAIRKLIRSRGGSTKDAEDVFQEALLVLIRKVRAGNFQLTARLSTYLHSTCRFLWNNQLRKTRPQIPIDEATGLDPEEAASLLTEAGQDNRIRLARQALQDLKDRCRELLLLFYEDELPLKAIAARMGYSSDNTAKNQKYKCLEAARNRLKELTSSNPLNY
jgi:RNA polymerase sigma factor (sigma-70 family)